MSAIEIVQLEKRFVNDGADVRVLCGLELEVASGELLVLVGPSGCGKSTALRLLAGLDEPSSGSIKLDGKSLAGVAARDRDMAMVFQGYALYPHMSVAENIGFPLKMRGMAKAERARRVQETAAIVGLESKLQRLPSELSGGERQRVAMARAIVRKPKVFLFDEPLSNLDAKLRAELRVELASLVRRLGVTAIYVTHDQAEAMTMADRVAVMNQGRLQQVGTPQQVYALPANVFVAGFIGTPAMNLLPVHIEAGLATGPGLRCPAPEGMAGDATVGFRPEQLCFDAGEATESNSLRLKASVSAIEPMGADDFVHLACEEQLLRARTAGFSAPEIGASCHVAVPRSATCWFDAMGERQWPPKP